MWPSGSLVQLTDKTKKNKQRAEQEPHLAHGRTVNKGSRAISNRTRNIQNRRVQKSLEVLDEVRVN